MIRNTLTLLTALTLALAFAAMSAQAEEPDYAQTGAYAGGAIGIGMEKFGNQGLPAVHHDAFVGSITGGYRLHPHIAVEVQIEGGKYDGDAVGTDMDTKIYTYTVNVKGFLLTGQIQPYLMAGAGLAHAKRKVKKSSLKSISLDDSAFAARFGGGVDYWITESISLGVAASYVLPRSSLDSLEYISVAGTVRYRF
jgi:opacity protein-like surface antigen